MHAMILGQRDLIDCRALLAWRALSLGGEVLVLNRDAVADFAERRAERYAGGAEGEFNVLSAIGAHPEVAIQLQPFGRQALVGTEFAFGAAYLPLNPQSRVAVDNEPIRQPATDPAPFPGRPDVRVGGPAAVDRCVVRVMREGFGQEGIVCLLCFPLMLDWFGAAAHAARLISDRCSSQYRPEHSDSHVSGHRQRPATCSTAPVGSVVRPRNMSALPWRPETPRTGV